VTPPVLDESLYQLARGAGLGLALLVVLAAERWRPHVRLGPAWTTNFGLWAIDAVVMSVLCGACGFALAGWVEQRGIGLLGWAGIGGGLAVGAGLLGLDAVSYLWHRANHRVPLLWRFHQVHHADASFHATTGLRFHPGELILALPVRLAAIALLGVPPAGVLVFELLFGIANLVEHGNFDWPPRAERVLQRGLITPALHRAHHVADWRELNTNFGTVLSLWDRLGRTFRASEPGRRVATGLPDSREPPPRLAACLWLPFSRRVRL
jgi:sterol desaturase/sphingolipid hydroxylase (fatty acid hydroxylase superfamily)